MVKNAFERLAYIDATIQSFDKERHVWTHILSQSMLGLCVSGLFYGWGALATTIDSVFSPNNSGVFENLHGTFTGVIILVLSVIPMVPLRLILDAKIINEFQSQAIGLFITIVGLVLGGISLKFKILWLLYIGCSVPCGVGSLMVFQRLVFSHQLWFKMIEKQNLGAGIFGFGIGLWTAIFFLISSPLLKLFSIDLVLYLYSALLFLCIIWPLLTINDDILDLVCKTTTSSSSIDNSEAEKIKEDNSDNCNNSHSNFSKINYIGNNDQEQFEIHGNDNFIRHELKKNAEVNLSQETMEITYKEVCNCKQTWIIFFFFAAVLTPGWGIKLASYAMLKNMFTATVEYSSVISALYTAIYAIGRLCSGFLAQVVGIKKTYDIMICTMIVILVLLPETIRNMDHSSQNSLGCKIFVFLICIVGLMVYST